ncbi:hypothetical protein EVAR_68324_1 [Eumeta japonica]|uniref:Uncharacterized protein n=1 Tax=Eumeta variegata TaxID=151549 RepID=A0A4C2ADV7_EUMVA|nr:hypothetical protein EVAR_68324_1 [Eumeta japonica]
MKWEINTRARPPRLLSEQCVTCVYRVHLDGCDNVVVDRDEVTTSASESGEGDDLYRTINYDDRPSGRHASIEMRCSIRDVYHVCSSASAHSIRDQLRSSHLA